VILVDTSKLLVEHLHLVKVLPDGDSFGEIHPQKERIIPLILVAVPISVK
jgi:hypothetical protein